MLSENGVRSKTFIESLLWGCSLEGMRKNDILAIPLPFNRVRTRILLIKFFVFHKSCPLFPSIPVS